MNLALSKIKGPKELSRIVKTLKTGKKRIVFTNGCFDIIHAGHVVYLEKARALGDVLIVGLNSDASVTALKGSGRPINRASSRARVLAALSAVDYVTVFREQTPVKLIKIVAPDVLVKGGDWDKNRIAGAEFVRNIGGKVVIIPFVKGHSTTAIINNIKISGKN